MKPANASLTMVAWLRHVLPGVPTATTLPADVDSWAGTGFITVTTEVGIAPQAYVPWRESALQLDCWGVRPNTRNPDWAKANELAELAVEAAYANQGLNVALHLRDGWRRARVTSVIPLTDPEQAPDDPAAYGHYQLDLQLNWIEIPE